MYHCPLPISAFIAAVVESKSACPVLPLVSAQSDRPRRFNFFVIAPVSMRLYQGDVCSICQTQRPSSHPQRHHAPGSVVGPRTVRWATFLDRLDDAWTGSPLKTFTRSDSMMNHFERSIMQSVSIYSNGAVGGLKMTEPARKVFDEERSTLAASEPAASEVDVTCICDVSSRSLSRPTLARELLHRARGDDTRRGPLRAATSRTCAACARGNSVCFVGSPGIGKTTTNSLLRAHWGGTSPAFRWLGRQTWRRSRPLDLGRSSAWEWRTLEDALVYIVEVLKIRRGITGYPALLELLESDQNNWTQSPHRVDFAVDLSRLLFVSTVHTPDTIPPPLLDRTEVLEVLGYTSEDNTHPAASARRRRKWGAGTEESYRTSIPYTELGAERASVDKIQIESVDLPQGGAEGVGGLFIPVPASAAETEIVKSVESQEPPSNEPTDEEAASIITDSLSTSYPVATRIVGPCLFSAQCIGIDFTHGSRTPGFGYLWNGSGAYCWSYDKPESSIKFLESRTRKYTRTNNTTPAIPFRKGICFESFVTHLMDVRERHYFHVFTVVVANGIDVSFHVRYLWRVDSCPDLSYHPTSTSAPTFAICPGQGCSFSKQEDEHTIHWLLVPPFSRRDCKMAVRLGDPQWLITTWMRSDRWGRAEYVLQEGDILCAAYLIRQDRSFEPPRFVFRVECLLSDGPVRRRMFLVAPSAWRGGARVRVSISLTLLECNLPDGRVIWVKVDEGLVSHSLTVGLRLRLGRMACVVWRWFREFVVGVWRL
ncbi:hypothetical protein C8F04DRAFT_1177964 [Mycena alexandri]|uniref:Uncharacterized protein n=1 Tax=Mycena alexandri TaxID=1745969 RepID=A0AAD6X8J4_9AGAR|nr:hypothetical protein C8F04DRAFT_1177964 [Mycena alexandri]